MSNISNLLSIFDSGEYSKFLLEYSSIITNDNENDNLITARGIAYLRIGEPENSIINFNKLLEKNPNNKEAIIYKTCNLFFFFLFFLFLTFFLFFLFLFFLFLSLSVFIIFYSHHLLFLYFLFSYIILTHLPLYSLHQ